MTTSVNYKPSAGGAVAGSALTGSYATVLDASALTGGVIQGILIVSSCDKDYFVSLDGGATDTIKMLGIASQTVPYSIFIPFGACNLIGKRATIQAKHAGAAPTAGSFSVTVFSSN